MKKGLLEKLAATKEKAKALYTVISSREGSTATKEELEQIEKYSAEVDQIQKMIDNADKFMADTAASVGGEAAKAAPAAVVEVVQKEKTVFKNLGDQLISIVAMSKDSLSSDEKAKHYNKLMTVEKFAPSGLGSQKDTEGGYLIEAEISREIIKTQLEYDDILSDCRVVPISSGKNRFEAHALDDANRADSTRLAGVQAYWANEADTVSATKNKLRKIEFALHKLMAIGYATEENLEDAAQLSAIMIDSFVEDFNHKLREAIFWGEGTDRPRGFIDSPATLSVAIEGGQTAKVLFENVLKMFNRMPASMRSKAFWYMNQELLDYLPFMKVDLGTYEHPVYMPAGGATGAQYETLFGRPIKWTEQNAAPGTKGDIVFANLNQYLIGQKGAARLDVSMHVRFLNDEQCFRAVQRVGGSPLPASVITPKRGSADYKLSPFIVLAAR